jgi:hypothetical protein
MKNHLTTLVRTGAAVATVAGAFVSRIAFAQGVTVPEVEGLRNEFILTTILDVIGWGLAVAGAVAVLFLVVGGFLYITAGGDEQRLEKAKSTLKNAIIGTVFILISLVIIVTLNTILGQQ